MMTRREIIKQGGLAFTAPALPFFFNAFTKFNYMTGGKNSRVVDTVIIGAGAAGLSAALFLVRARRSVLIFDAGSKRISATSEIHELLGFEGKTPMDFHKTGKKEVLKYGGEIRKEKVTVIESISDNFFKIQTSQSNVITRTVVIATGLTDVLPDISGLKEGWGKDIHICPCFTGYELYNKKVVVFGLHERIGQLSKFLTAWTNNVTVVTDQEFEPTILKKLNAVGVGMVKSKVVSIVRSNGKLKAVKTKAGNEIACEAVFVATPLQATSDLASTLCGVDELGFAITDINGKTSRDGVWVIGNANDPIGHLAHSIAAGTSVGPIVTDYIIEQAIKENE